MKLGAQLYTVRDYTNNLKDFEETLKKISEIGYEYVQVSGTCDYNSKWLRDMLKKYNLKCSLTHISSDKLQNSIEYVIEEHNDFDCKYIGLGIMPDLWNKDVELEDIIANFKKNFIPVMEKCKAAGKYFMYHNHDLEFVKLNSGKTSWQTLIDDIPADLMGFTVDTFWIQKGGCNPSTVIRELKGRCPVVHFKDYKMTRDGAVLAACGDGNLNFADIIKACEEAGTEYIMVEQDDCFSENPFDCLERSYKYLKSLGI